MQHPVQLNNCEASMVEIARGRPVTVFRVLDRNGRPIGEVVQPKIAPVMGVGARTVLLVRGRDGRTEGTAEPA
jgi:hypothetical protein